MDSQEKKAYAMEVARLIYGTVVEQSPEWANCLAVVENLKTEQFIFDSTQRWNNSKKNFEIAATFNRECPVGTEGAIDLGKGRKLQCAVNGPAGVFPDPIDGEVVMAWFTNAGWKETKLFSTENKAVSIAQELTMLASQAKNLGKNDMALLLLDAAISADASYWEAPNEKSAILYQLGRYKEALEACAAAFEHKKDSGIVLNNFGSNYRALGDKQKCYDNYRAASELMPGNDHIKLNLATALDDLGRTNEALDILDSHIKRFPGNSNPIYNRALLLLSAGRLAEGWKAYEARFNQPMTSEHYEHFNIPRWQGEPLAGKKVLMWCEQGIGDEILTLTMLPDLLSTGAEVTVICDKRLMPLVERSFPSVKVDESISGPLPMRLRREAIPPQYLPREVLFNTFDYQVSQGDLGAAFRASHEALFQVRERSILRAHGERVSATRIRLKTMYPGKRLIGISWHSNRNLRIGAMKSIPLKALAPILSTPNCAFINLQYGDNSDDIAALEKETGLKLCESGVDQLSDLDSFSVLVAALDLTITVSNTTAHVSGALGKPTWVLTPEGPGRLWYWFRDSMVCPWYTSIVLFRQPSAAQWTDTIATVASTLQRFVSMGSEVVV